MVHAGADLKEEEGRQVLQAWLVVQLDKARKREYSFDPLVQGFAEQVRMGRSCMGRG